MYKLPFQRGLEAKLNFQVGEKIWAQILEVGKKLGVARTLLVIGGNAAVQCICARTAYATRTVNPRLVAKSWIIICPGYTYASGS